MRKLLLVLCVLFSAFGLWSCSSDASADSTPAADNTELTARVATLEAVVAGLKVPKLYSSDYDADILGVVLSADEYSVTALTSTGMLFTLDWNNNTASTIYYDGTNCTGNAYVPSFLRPINLIVIKNPNWGEYYAIDLNQYTGIDKAGIVSMQPPFPSPCGAPDNPPTSFFYRLKSITPADAGLPVGSWGLKIR
jgi:hypothetical protein